ncbi:MAG: hypothetical protein O7F11_02025 [Acidobacteria bacterium]|nr:hypothetical protein [Acidobacteriota bacterium]
MARRAFMGLQMMVILSAGAGWSGAQETPDLEEILARHAQGHGGHAAWKKVKSYKMEGTWEAFSDEAPFTLYRQRPNLYYFEHNVLGAPSTLAYDGSRPWVRSAAYGAPQGRVIAEDAGRNVTEDSAFGCTLLAHQADGAAMKLDGRVPQEGSSYWQVTVTPDDGNTEIWYLDPETGLEFKRVNQTFDVFSGNIETEMETFYLDFRQVGEVHLAFREERHFGTRYHVLQAESVELNPAVDASVFKLPAGATTGDGETGGE